MRRFVAQIFVSHLHLATAILCLCGQSATEAADKELVNREWHFSLRYPEAWKYTPRDNARPTVIAVFTHGTADDETEHATITAVNLREPLKLSDVVAQTRRSLESRGAIDFQESDVKVGPLPARRITWTTPWDTGPAKTTQVFVENSGLFYAISFGGDKPIYDRYLAEFEGMLASFMPKMKPVAARQGYPGTRFTVLGESLSLTFPETWRLRPGEAENSIALASTWQLSPDGGSSATLHIAMLPLLGDEKPGTDDLATFAAKETLAAVRATQPAEKSSDVTRLELDGKPAATFWTDRRRTSTVSRTRQYFVLKPNGKAVYMFSFSTAPDREEEFASVWESIIKSVRIATE